jgi:hypothetical protein
MPVGVNKRVYVNDALIFDYHHVGVQIEGLEFVKADSNALIRLKFIEESDTGSLKGLLTDVHYGTVPLLEVYLEIQGVIFAHRCLLLERISIVILKNFIIFG